MTPRAIPDASPGRDAHEDAGDLEIEREGLLILAAAATRKAEEADRARQEFVGAIAHELRRPLTVLLAWIPMLRRAGPTDAALVARGLAAIERASKEQARLIEELLGRSELAPGRQQVDLAATLESARDVALRSAEQKGIRLETSRDPTAATCFGDASAMRYAVSRLLAHAIELAPPGGSVAVRVAREGATIRLSVQAAREGIVPEPGDETPSRSQGEPGPRLLIVRLLVELQGGTLTADSPDGGERTTLTVALPAASAPTGPEAGEEPKPDPASPADGSTRSALRGVRVLLVEDDADGRETLVSYLQQHGAQVEAVASAGEAMEALRRNRPDVLVSDIGLPGTDGYELISQVRELRPEEGGRLPALALTGFAREQDRSKAASAGYQAHVVKPVDPSALVAKIAQLAGRDEAG